MEVSTLEKTSYAYQKPKYTKPCPLHFQLKQKVVIIKKFFFSNIFTDVCFEWRANKTKQSRIERKRSFLYISQRPLRDNN